MAWDAISLDYSCIAKRALPVILLAAFWCWETWQPFFGQPEGRLKHAARNLAIALFNTFVLAVAFGSVTVFVAEWSAENQFGLLNVLSVSGPIHFGLALVLLDGWMYVWHRANHVIPLLWRFHRMHHSDRNMDVTTATRFHLGEQVLSSVLRLGIIPLLGIEVWNLVAYDALVLAVIMCHHADVSLGRWDRWLRWLIVTPDMHKVHHSDQQPETDSNYSTVLSIWDRLARSFRMRSNPKTIVFGLEEFTDTSWQTWWGMWKTPFSAVKRVVFTPKNFARWSYDRVKEWAVQTKCEAYVHVFRKTALQLAWDGEDEMAQRVAEDAGVSQSVLLGHYVKPKLWRKSNRTYYRIHASLPPEVASQYGFKETPLSALERKLEAARADKDWPLVAELAAKLAQEQRSDAGERQDHRRKKGGPLSPPLLV